MRPNRRTPKVFYSRYSQTQRQSRPLSQPPGQLRQLVIVFLVIVGGYFLTRLPIFQINQIVLAGSDNAELISQLDTIKGESLLSGAVNKKVAQVKSLHPELGELECIKGIPNTLRCQAVERSPELVWQTNGQAYVLDREGIAYQNATPSGVPVVEDRKNVAIELGDQPINTEVAGIYRDTQVKLSENGYVVDRFFISTSVLHAGVILSGRANGLPFPAHPIEVELSLSYPISVQVTILNQLLETRNNQIANRVDLRTPGYLFYQ